MTGGCSRCGKTIDYLDEYYDACERIVYWTDEDESDEDESEASDGG